MHLNESTESWCNINATFLLWISQLHASALTEMMLVKKKKKKIAHIASTSNIVP